MLGIFLIICLAVFWFIQLKAYNLLKAEHARRWSLNEGDAIETGCSLQTLIKKVQIILTC